MTDVTLDRRIGPLQATAINMTQMCGIGPFVTIPLMVAAMGGPQAVFGWVIGAVIALADGLVWAELGAALPGSGGTYVYLREAFAGRRGQGRLMPFLFGWTAVLFIPLIMSTGVIGLVSYLGYLWPGVVGPDGQPNWLGHLVGVLIVALVMVLLYRGISGVAKLATGFFVVMLVATLSVILAAFTHFDPGLAFAYPAGAFSFGGPFWTGLGAGLVLAVYDYLGYNTSAYLGAELRDPGRTLPRSIVFAILGIMTLYLLLQLGVLGVVPWHQIIGSSSVASLVLERTWGPVAAVVLTVLIVVAAFASVFTGLLGGSRVPFEAARDRVFLPWFSRVHPRLGVPYRSVLVLGVITAVGSLFALGTVISMLTAVMVIVQSVAQVVALVVLRRVRRDLPRPYRQWAYPLPAVVALAGWIYIYFSSGWTEVLLSVGWVVLGGLVFAVWSRTSRPAVAEVSRGA